MSGMTLTLLVSALLTPLSKSFALTKGELAKASSVANFNADFNNSGEQPCPTFQ
jgi:hypothetical protein